MIESLLPLLDDLLFFWAMIWNAIKSLRILF